MSEYSSACPDCKSVMQPIKVIDATSLGMGSEGAGHVPLAYAAPDASRSFFLGKIQRTGVLTGRICPKCGRVVLYGEPPV